MSGNAARRRACRLAGSPACELAGLPGSSHPLAQRAALRLRREGEYVSEDVSEDSKPGQQDGVEAAGVARDLDPALSIPTHRLAGSDSCLNCGAGLEGPYCHHCGQPDKRFKRFLPLLLRDLLTDLLDWDSRFLRTMLPLLFRPGRLTRDFLEGKRFRYTPPLRLYLFTSLVFFLLAALLSRDLAQWGSGPGGRGPVIRFGAGADRADAAAREAREAIEASGAIEATEAPEASATRKPSLSVNGREWDRETNPVELSWLPAWANRLINDEIERSPAKLRAIEANPSLFTDKMEELLPATMFLLLPFSAILLQLWHPFTKRFYVEHLIFALHAHAFTFAAFSLLLVVGSLGDDLAGPGKGALFVLSVLLRVLVLTWLPIYFLLALRHVYRQAWWLCVIKFAGIAFSYLVMLGMATGVLTLTSFVLL